MEITYPFKTPPSEIQVRDGWISFLFHYDNGYGAAVTLDEEGRYELAVLELIHYGVWVMCRKTPITDDVINNLYPSEVDSLLERIRNLC